ncbi:MAG: GTP-binding protein [Candidatus Heimdallarchaeota archaeon]|nr:GTP-binding protein [Candidatus Heimdallarchaeota archaeon]MCK4876554.1 GTP-binding protein [Candidatus Heimdallarchaeota archaeon]
MIFKVLTLGDYGTGKSTIFSQFLNNVPEAERKPSIKLDLIEFKRTIGGKEVTINLYDIPGRELTSDNRSKHYKNTTGAIIIFDICRPDSFRHVPFWLEELMNYSGIGKVPILLIGNKSDLRETSQRTLNPIDAKEYVFRLNRTTRVDGVENHFIELSAKSGKGLIVAIDMLVESMIKHQELISK